MPDDTGLILACEDFIRTYQRLVSVASHGDPDECEVLTEMVEDLAERIAARRPNTLAGIRAKAQAAVLLWGGEGRDFTNDDELTHLARALLIELAAMPAPVSASHFHPTNRMDFALADRAGTRMPSALIRR